MRSGCILIHVSLKQETFAPQVGNRWLEVCDEVLGNCFPPHHSVTYFKTKDDACGFIVSLVR